MEYDSTPMTMGSEDSEHPKLTNREIIPWQNSNMCDHNPPTLQTDGRRDGAVFYIPANTV